ncbi:MAG TPA: tetratricopeptide repeat protein [Steroidobacteraceae bacterium]|nr:tetratricopeptide repeat protein [Steroidobacteraceae bacterium]
MDDYLSEKEQWEWLKASARENAPAVLLALVVVAAAVFGWRWWQSHQDARQLEAGGKYMQMVQALEHSDRTQALVLLGELERDYSGTPYADQARLLAARVYVDEAQLDHAANELSTVMQSSRDRDLALIARLRLARVQIAQGKPDAALATLAAQKDPGAFAARYHEVRGDAYYAKGEKVAALAEYRSAQTAGAAGTDTSLLQLKIADLASGTAPVTPTAATREPAGVAGTPAAGK